MRKLYIFLLVAAFTFISNASAEDCHFIDLQIPFLSEESEKRVIEYMKDMLDERLNESYNTNESLNRDENDSLFSKKYTYYAKEYFDYIYEYGMIYPKEKANYWEVYAFENNLPYSFWKAEFSADGEIREAPWYYGIKYSPVVSDLEAVEYAFDFLKNHISAFLTNDINASRIEMNEEKVEIFCRDFYLGLEVEDINPWCYGKRCIPILFLCQDNHGNECMTPWWYVVIERMDNMDWSIMFFYEDVQYDNKISANRASLYSFDYNWFPTKNQLVFNVQISSKTGEALSSSF